MSAPDDNDSPAGDFQRVEAFDVSDSNGRVLAEHMRALQREMRSGFELITNKLLTSIERISDKFDDLSDKFDDLHARTESRFARIEARLDALESKRAPRPRKR